MDKFNIRFIKNNNKIYLLAEDVASFIKEIASTEETDVRNRLNEAASNLMKE